jgi:uncharacterized delta-60 repeat protein
MSCARVPTCVVAVLGAMATTLCLVLTGCGNSAATSGDAGARDATQPNRDASTDAARSDAGDADAGEGGLSCSGGMLDPTFGSGGTVLTSVGNNGSAIAVLLEPDGHILAVGSDRNSTTSSFAGNFVAARYEADGGLDPTFGEGGTLVSTVATSAYAYAGALQPDGKILIAGTRQVAADGGMPYVATLVRLNADGTADDSFGAAGIVTEVWGSVQDTIAAVAIQSDGSIVAIGWAPYDVSGSDYTDSPDGFIVLRYLPNGQRDPSFGDNGEVMTILQGDDEADGLALEPDSGKIVAAGYSSPPLTPDSGTPPAIFGLVRYDSDGGTDKMFGVGGIDSVKVTGAAYATGVALQTDGKIVTSGSTGKSSVGFEDGVAATRFDPSGAIDTTFGSGGSVNVVFHVAPGYKAFGETVYAGGVETYGLAIASDGKILVSGIVPTAAGVCCAYGLVRFTSNGEPDTTFGDHGVVVTQLTGSDEAFAMAVQPDGKIILGGASGTLTKVDHVAFSLARYCP